MNVTRFSNVCESEALAASHAIQGHGFSLIVDRQVMRLVGFSQNTPFDDLQIGCSLDFLTNVEIDGIRRMIRPHLVTKSRCIDGRWYDCWIIPGLHDQVLLEWEESSGVEVSPIKVDNSDYNELIEHLSEIQKADRWMIYRFESDNCGTVIAEKARAGVTSYLGLRYPATDIPKVARELYKKTEHRYIFDSSAAPVPLTFFPTMPIDLTLSQLRSVSPYHIRYMQNMGVATSLSISIMAGHELWGLATMHHREPLRVAPEVRQSLVNVVKEFIRQWRRSVIDQQIRAVETKSAVVRAQLDAFLRGSITVDQFHQETKNFMKADGVAIICDQDCLSAGDTPQAADIIALQADLFRSRHFGTFQTDMIKHQFVMESDLAGLLVVWAVSAIDDQRHFAIQWYRNEVVREVNWGSASTLPSSSELCPEASFGNWKAMMRDHSRPWLAEELGFAKVFLGAIVERINKSSRA